MLAQWLTMHREPLQGDNGRSRNDLARLHMGNGIISRHDHHANILAFVTQAVHTDDSRKED